MELQGANYQRVLIGTVVSNDDATCTGRIKARIPGANDGIPVEQLPWISYGGGTVFSQSGCGNISIPKVGHQVRITTYSDDMNVMYWENIQRLDDKLIKELAQDYKDSCFLMYDADHDVTVKFQKGSGLVAYYKGSQIQITPDNTINVFYGGPDSGEMIQLTNGKVSIISPNVIEINAANTIKMKASNIVLDAEESLTLSGDNPGECAVNGKALMELLSIMGSTVDLKVPCAGVCASLVNSQKESIINQKIHYI